MSIDFFKEYAIWNVLQNNLAGQEKVYKPVCVHRLESCHILVITEAQQ